MTFGPVLIFDKSTLQSLSVDESVWLDQFFFCNITPLFYIEVLADLEKEIRKGRKPEDVVGNLAYKTPDAGSRPNAHHRDLLSSELFGLNRIDMRFGRPIISGGKNVVLEGKSGTIFKQAPEQEAFHRWREGKYLQVERDQAKLWRRELAGNDFSDILKHFREYVKNEKPRDLETTKQIAEEIVNRIENEDMIKWGLGLIGFSNTAHERVVSRWKAHDRPHVRSFAPYFSYVLSVDIFFYLATVSDLISRERHSNRADIAYTYYLPFCNVFTSNDSLHKRVVPLFINNYQTFIEGSILKEDFAKLDNYYSQLPEETKQLGVFNFAHYPPTDGDYIVTKLWDKYMSKIWREQEKYVATKKDASKEEELIQLINRLKCSSVKNDLPIVPNSDEVDFSILEQPVYARKGKWIRCNHDL